MIRAFITILVATTLALPTRAAEKPLRSFEDIVAAHPAREILRRLFPDPVPPAPADFHPTGITKKDYLRLIAGNVDFWKRHLSPEGAILDPYELDPQTHKPQERQYSTPPLHWRRRSW